jgi:crossover junction endodeoxyribonuclease RuvC
MILGIDPGSRTTGFGIILFEKNKTTSVDYGTWFFKGEMPERLSNLQMHLAELVSRYAITGLVLEQTFVHLNVSSALKLGQVRGVVMAFAAGQGIPLHEYAARQVKQAVVGTGAADKKQVQHMVSMLLGLQEIPVHDAADALALAIAHCHWRKDLPQNRVTKRKSNQRKGWTGYVRTSKR